MKQVDILWNSIGLQFNFKIILGYLFLCEFEFRTWSKNHMKNERLSADTLDLFVEAEIQAERTVALLRILIALTLGLVFVFAVLQIAPDNSALLRWQWVFAGSTMFAYFVLGIVSYLAIVFGVYRSWMAWIAVTGDVSFLLSNIWFGIQNTGLAPNYMTSLPPIWLAPVVLSFGALRFNPWLQTYLIALLLLGLIGITILDSGWQFDLNSPPPAIINIFFSLPPNVMRISMLALAGLILVIASLRAKALLVREINETRRKFNLTRYLPKQVSELLAESEIDELRRGSRKCVAVLFVDIREFTKQSEPMSPDKLSNFITEFRYRITRAADSANGTIDKFIGDAAMIVFGLIPSNENHAASALQCADLIMNEIRDWNTQREKELKVGIGVHWGEVFSGAIGDETRLEYTILGDTVNVASRIQELTKQTKWPILASSEVLKSAGQNMESKKWYKLDTITLRGRTGVSSLYGAM